MECSDQIKRLETKKLDAGADAKSARSNNSFNNSANEDKKAEENKEKEVQ